jgi:hypothetical protein
MTRPPVRPHRRAARIEAVDDGVHTPSFYGQPKEKQTQWGVHPAMVQQLAAQKSKIKANALNRGKNLNSNPQSRPSVTVNHAQLN